MQRLRFTGFLVLASIVPGAFAQFSLTEFNGIPFGSNKEAVVEKATGKLRWTVKTDAVGFNASEDAKFLGIVLANPTEKLMYYGDKGELVEYFICDNRLTAVLHTLPGKRGFSPRRVISEIDRALQGIEKQEIKDLTFPESFGRLDPKTELTLAYDWESADGRIRLACRAWPPKEVRQVLRVVHTSAEQNRLNQQRMAQLARKKAEVEAEKKRLAEAAARKAAAGTPAPPPAN